SALWQDALNYHMIDQPEKLIAMRLTEYYELVARGTLRPGPSVPGAPNTPTANIAPTGNNVVSSSLPPPSSGGRMATPLPAANSSLSNGNHPNGIHTSRTVSSQPMEEIPIDTENDVVTRSSSMVVEQNADDAADYWSPL